MRMGLIFFLFLFWLDFTAIQRQNVLWQIIFSLCTTRRNYTYGPCACCFVIVEEEKSMKNTRRT